MNKTTEDKNPLSENIDQLEVVEILKIINDEDKLIPLIINKHLHEIKLLIDMVVGSFESNGHLFYVGCGSSGRLGVLDASECPPTFSVDNTLVQGIIAGGNKALHTAVEGAEDIFENGINDLREKNIKENDTVIGISASGGASYVLGALKYANKCNAKTALITFNNIRKHNFINKTISIILGPEIIAGSTRMKSGTATKMILNMISTASMIKINKTYKNLMVDLKVSNNKLLDRAIRIVSELTNNSYKISTDILNRANNNVKIAVVMELLNLDYDSSKTKLDLSNGNLRKALK